MNGRFTKITQDKKNTSILATSFNIQHKLGQKAVYINTLGGCEFDPLGFALKEFLVDIQVPELSFRSTTFGGSNKDDCNFLFQVSSNLITPKTF